MVWPTWNATGDIIAISVTLVFYPMLVKQLGGLKDTLVAGSILSTIPTLTIPLITYVPAEQLTVQLVLLSIVLGAKSVCQSSAFTSSLILLNQSVRAWITFSLIKCA